MSASAEQNLPKILWQGLIGHDKVENRIFELVSQGKLPPVLLLEGRPGIGKSQLAGAIVARHFCEEGVACGDCRGCKWVQSGMHPEILWIDSNGEQLKVPHAVEVIDHLSLAPQLGDAAGAAKPARIAVLIDIDLMNEYAVNKLLKLLEEPPENAKIIMTSSRSHSLLPTLLSRANKWKVKPPQLSETIEILRRNCDTKAFESFDSGALETLIRRNGLSPGKSIQAVDDSALESKNSEFGETCRNLVDPDRIISVLERSEELAAFKRPAAEIAREAEIALNQRYRSQFLGNQRPKVAEGQQAIRNRRNVLSQIKYFAGRKKIALNSLLSAEGIGLSKFNRN